MAERYKREIDEILQQAGGLNTGSPNRPSLPRIVLVGLTQSLGGKNWSLRPGRVMLIAIVLLLSALITGTPLLAWSGLVLFIVGYAMFFIRPPKIEKRWRGQPIDYSGEAWWDRLRKRFK
tara:strand:+ start:316 stop:675 length:360 start_codon:yes stop_codon:yes gene_type:complete